jgi:hypothetical protein
MLHAAFYPDACMPNMRWLVGCIFQKGAQERDSPLSVASPSTSVSSGRGTAAARLALLGAASVGAEAACIPEAAPLPLCGCSFAPLVFVFADLDPCALLTALVAGAGLSACVPCRSVIQVLEKTCCIILNCCV